MRRPRTTGLVPVLLCWSALGACSAGGSAGPVAPTPQASAPARPPVEERAAVVLREWDRRRAEAYAAGSVPRLRSLYVAGAGRADARLLQSYVDRGLTVRGMRVQVLALRVLRDDDRLLGVRVTDRVVGAEAWGSSGAIALPRDSPTTRVLTLRHVGGAWRVSSVRPARP